MPRHGKGPGWRLVYLYVGSSDIDADLALWRNVAGATLLWDVRDDGDRVAALEVGPGPRVLLANHRPAPSVLPVYAVDRLAESISTMADRGWRPVRGPLEIPDGTCHVFRDASGNEIALMEVTRPDAFQEMGR